MKEMILYRFRFSTHKYRVVFASRFQGISREIISFLFISLFRCLYTEYPRELDPEIDAGSAKKSRTFLVLEELWSGAQSRWAGWRGRSLRIQSGKEQCCERREPVDPLDRAGGWRTEPEGHLGLCPEASVPLQGRQGSRGCIPDAPGETGIHLEWKQRTPLCSRVTAGPIDLI